MQSTKLRLTHSCSACAPAPDRELLAKFGGRGNWCSLVLWNSDNIPLTQMGLYDKFATGVEIPANGIYRVFHPEHRLIRTITLSEGEIFPRCSQCADQVTFELLQSTPDVFQYERVHIFELPLRQDDEKPGPG